MSGFTQENEAICGLFSTLPQVYGSIDAQIETCTVSYSPGYEFVISELFAALQRMTPRAVDPSPHIPYWDVLRHVIHLSFRVSYVFVVCLHLLAWLKACCFAVGLV